MDGLMLVDKPYGWTSHDVVAKVRSELKKMSSQKVKVGHTGTLDPMATGLLLLVIGSYTKQANKFLKLNKVYKAELTLGKNSTTGDSEGELTWVSDDQPNLAQIQTTLNKFIGKSLQQPPAYSAIKVDGQRAYKLARAGKSPDLKHRQVEIGWIKNIEYKYPILKFDTEVSSGTYIRSLAEDIGKELGGGAYLSALRRTKIGGFKVEVAASIDKISISDIIKV